MFENHPPITDPARLRALEEVIAATAEMGAAFDELAGAAAVALNVPISLITFVEAEQQIFKGEHGLPATLAVIRNMPISYSICQFTIAEPRPLIISDANIHPLVMHHSSVHEMGIKAYLGIPLILTSGDAIGSLSFVGYVKREWSEEDLATAESLAGQALQLIEDALFRHREQADA